MSQPSSSLPYYSITTTSSWVWKQHLCATRSESKTKKWGLPRATWPRFPWEKKIFLLNAQKDLVTHLGGLCWIDTCEKAEFDAKAPQVKWRAGSLFKKRLYQTTFSSIIFQSISNLCMFFAQHLRARVHKLQGQQQHVFLRLHPELQFHWTRNRSDGISERQVTSVFQYAKWRSAQSGPNAISLDDPTITRTPLTRSVNRAGVCTYNTIQYNTILYNTILYNTILYNKNTIQYNTIQYYTILYYTIQIQIQYNTYSTLRYITLCYVTLHYIDMTWHDMTWHDMTWHDMTRHDMTWHDMTWHDMTWHDIQTYILHTYIPTYLPTCLPTYLHTCIHAYMHTCIHAYIPTYLPTYLHNYIHITLHYITLHNIT